LQGKVNHRHAVSDENLEGLGYPGCRVYRKRTMNSVWKVA
jgi:hypothetical protein